MTATALVTGSAARVDDVARAIERRGVTVRRIDRDGPSPLAGEAFATEALDYYVQLPGEVPSPNSTEPGAVAALFGLGLMSRFGEVESLLSKLAPRSAVVLVTGETVGEPTSPAYPHAPTCLLEMLAEAIVAQLSPSSVRARVVSHRHSADEIADIALANGPERDEFMTSYASLAPEMSYDDWRLALLTGASAGSLTAFG